jgi:hypothetical protein
LILYSSLYRMVVGVLGKELEAELVLHPQRSPRL